MAHTLAAVFDNRQDAERARDQLVSAGFDNSCMRLNDSSSRYADASGNAASTSSLDTSTTTRSADMDEDRGFMDSVRHFFSNLFGDDHDDNEVYAEAVNRGNVVLTVQSESQDEIERAADIVEACGPLDIDEQKTQWQSSGWTGAAAASTAASRQSMGSMQSGAGNLQASGTGSQQRMESAGSVQRSTGDATRAIPVIEEDLKVGKRTVDRGGVRVFQRVVERPVEQDVSLREEHVKVERHAVDKPVDPSDLKAFKETSFELHESAEEAVVQKTARVVEEVVVSKEQTQRTQHISDKVRQTKVDVEKLGAVDDEQFRSHWKSNYATSGRAYDEYAPAYQYGYSMAGNDTYRGRKWDEVETGLRSDWEREHPGSAWENFKAAVRHGWDRMTS